LEYIGYRQRKRRCQPPVNNPLEILAMFALLTAPEIPQATSAQHFMVEVASNAHDHEGVSLDVRTVDLLVSVPTREAITLAIADVQWLKGYSLVEYWLLESACLEF